jgi:hypothetical protein
LSHEKKSSKTHKKYLNNFLWPKIFPTNTLYANVYKKFECDKNKMPYCTIKNFKKSNFLGFWAVDKTWPALDKFCFFIFLSEKNRYFKCLHKILEQNYFIGHEKKRWNVRHIIGKVKKKVNLGVLEVSSYISKRAPQSCLHPTYGC